MVIAPMKDKAKNTPSFSRGIFLFIGIIPAGPIRGIKQAGSGKEEGARLWQP